MAVIRMNSRDALVLAAMAKMGGVPRYAAADAADMVEVFFEHCSETLKSNYVWTIDDLLALLDPIFENISLD